MTLDKILQRQGFGTRKACQRLIRAGAVAIADRVVTRFDESLETQGLTFTVAGQPWTYREHVYVALHKPPGFECSRRPSHHPGVLTLLPPQFTERNVQPVGRLDHDTTGLLLLTDDGAFIHAQSSPRRHVAKTYMATTHTPVTEDLVQRLCEGVKLIDEPVALAARHARALDTHQIEIILEQGKYHQVKRMLAAAGNHCLALHRSAIGRLTLDSLKLPAGRWCHLDSLQLDLLA